MPEINSEDKVAKNYQEVEGITNADRTTVDAYVRDSGKNAEGTLTTLMKKSAEELKEKRIEAYKKDKGMQNLDDVARREAEAYELPESELREACNATAKEMYDVYFERNRVLNKIMGNKSEIEAAQKAGQTPEYGKIKNHLDLLEKEDTDRQNKINEIQDKIKKLQEEGKEELPEGAKEGEEPKFVKQAEIDALQTEIDGLQEERKRIAEIKESTKALEERCRIAFKAQAEARENIENNLRETYGEKIADEAIKTHGSKQREQEYNELQNEAENKKKEDKNKEDKTQNDNLDQQNLDDLEKAGIAAGAAQQVAKGAVGGVPVQGAVAGVPQSEQQVEELEEDEPIVEDDGPSPYYDVLGFSEDNAMTRKDAKNLLKVFLGKKVSPLDGNKINDQMRLEMLNDPKTAKVLEQAIVKMNTKEKDGFLGMLEDRSTAKYNKKITDMLKTKLPKAAKQFGEYADKENLKKFIGKVPGIDMDKDVMEQMKHLGKEDREKLEKWMKNRDKSLKTKGDEIAKMLEDSNLTDDQRKELTQQQELLEKATKDYNMLYKSSYNLNEFQKVSDNAMNKPLYLSETIDTAKQTLDYYDKAKEAKAKGDMEKYNLYRGQASITSKNLKNQVVDMNNLSLEKLQDIANYNKNKEKQVEAPSKNEKDAR